MIDEKNFKNILTSWGIKYEFHPIAGFVRSVLYEPVIPNEKSRIGILVMHSDADYMTHDICEMARFGYRVLCAKVCNPNQILDQRILNVKAAVCFLREYPGIEKIVLWGHSGGATLLSAYQRIAENGVSCCQGPEKIHKCSDSLSGMPAADGIMLIDANWGNAVMTLLSIDPSVVSEDADKPLDRSLDLFCPDNGFTPAGSSYDRMFITRFQKAQGERSNRLIKAALNRLHCIENGESFFCDDEPLVIIGAAQGFMNNKLYPQDIRLLSHTKKAWPLIHADGSITEEIIHSVRKPANNESFTNSLYEGALITTVRNFLAEYAIYTTPEYSYNADSMNGIVWSSSYSTPVGNAEDIKAPTLIMGMTAGWEYIASESIYEHSGSNDKALAFVEGADHLYRSASECETWPGQYGDTLHTLFDCIDRWLSAKGRFCE